MKETVDIGLVSNIPSPYRIPLFNSIAGREDVKLTLYFMDVTEKNRSWAVAPEEWEFNHVFLDGSTWYSNMIDRSVAVNWGVIPRFRKASHDVIVIGGYNHTTCWVTLAYSKLSGTPVVPWNGTWTGSIRLDNPFVNTLRHTFARSGQAWIAYGSKAAATLSSWGADEKRIFEATNTVDVARFVEQSKKVSQEDVDDRFELLYCGQLIERKNVRTIINALSTISSDDVSLRVIGDGPEEKKLRRQADEADIQATFEGFVPRDELYRYYTHADVLVLPSTEEVWGLVVNEALACGTPALVSTKCGCAPDLIQEGFNGNTFDPAPDSFVDTITDLREEFLEYGDADEIRQDALNRFSIERSANAFVSACQTASNRS
jgi:glycosyltransferase involved in cell wall biosynthesis